MNNKRIRIYGLVALFLALLTAVLATHDDYGISWDESIQFRYGELVISYFATGFEDKRCNDLEDLKYYGPLFEMITVAASRIWEKDIYEIRHLVTALTAILAVAGIAYFGSRFSVPNIALFSAIALIMMPRFYGHMFINSKDIPFAVFFVWSMVSFAALFGKNAFSTGKVVFAGIAVGLALSVRIGGFLLFFFFAVITSYYGATHSTNFQWKSFPWGWIPKALGLIVIAWTVMVAGWPWTHENVFVNPIRAFLLATRFHQIHPVLFDGKIVMSNNLPWHYLPQIISVTMPPALLVFLLIGTVRSARTVIKSPSSQDGLYHFMILLWFFFPLAYVAVFRPNVYDGMRHFLFILPAAALLCGIGSAWMLGLFRQRLKKMMAVLLILLLLLPVGSLTSLHPYQMTYFNTIAGGMQNAWRQYETDYWTTSYREAMEWINNQVSPSDGNVKVVVAANTFNIACAEHFKKPNISIVPVFPLRHRVKFPPEAEYYLATTRYGFHQTAPEWPVVQTIGRNNAVFSVVKRRPGR